MAANSFEDLAAHIGHEIECVEYRGLVTAGVAVECVTCGCVLLDFDNDTEEDSDG